MLLVVVVAGSQSCAAAVFAGVFLGGPAIDNLFPHFTQLTSVSIGLAGITIGAHASGFFVDVVAPRWHRARAHPKGLAVVAAVLAVLWLARVGGVMHNWPWVTSSLAVVALADGWLAWRATRTAIDDGSDAARTRVPLELWGVVGPFDRSRRLALDAKLDLR